MKVKIIREANLDYAEDAINETIDCLEYNGYSVVDVRYMNEDNNGYGCKHYIMIIYK